MVQGNNYKNNTLNAFERDQPSKRAGFESMQKMQMERKKEASKPSNVSAFSSGNNKAKSGQPSSTSGNSKYGAWGPVFQNRENFNSMHFC